MTGEGSVEADPVADPVAAVAAAPVAAVVAAAEADPDVAAAEVVIAVASRRKNART